MTRTLEELTPQYIAGLFDGEGCASIYMHGSPRQHRRMHRPRVQISNQHGGVLYALKRRYGGTVLLGRGCYAWSATSKVLDRFIAEIEPHAVLKRRQLQILREARRLDGRNLPGQVPLPFHVWDYRESLRCEVQFLNGGWRANDPHS